VFFPTVPGAPSVAAPRWRLELMDGSERVVDGPVLIGRDPAASAADGAVTLLPVTDERKSVSKTHALLETRGDDLVVTDLGSTNGTSIVRDGARAMVEATERLAAGDVLMVGNVEIHVTRS
jgi:predicted component of type VI protein secretion system